MTESRHYKKATIIIEFTTGPNVTIEMHDDPEGIRMDGEIRLSTNPRVVESDLPWVVREPGVRTASVRLSGLADYLWTDPESES